MNQIIMSIKKSKEIQTLISISDGIASYLWGSPQAVALC